MVFVLLTYGGWNEAAYISGELRGRRRSIASALLWSMVAVTVPLPAGQRWPTSRGLGLAGVGKSEAVAADLLRAWRGPPGAHSSSACSSARRCSPRPTPPSSWALAPTTRWGATSRCSPCWGGGARAARRAGERAAGAGGHLPGAGGRGRLTRRGFETMVEYTAPVFWFFFLLAGVSLLVLRRREPRRGPSLPRAALPAHPAALLRHRAPTSSTRASPTPGAGRARRRRGAGQRLDSARAHAPAAGPPARQTLTRRSYAMGIRKATVGVALLSALGLSGGRCRGPGSGSSSTPRPTWAGRICPSARRTCRTCPPRRRWWTRCWTLAGVKQGDVLYDLGSGDGRIVVTAAQAPRRARGGHRHQPRAHPGGRGQRPGGGRGAAHRLPRRRTSSRRTSARPRW